MVLENQGRPEELAPVYIPPNAATAGAGSVAPPQLNNQPDTLNPPPPPPMPFDRFGLNAPYIPMQSKEPIEYVNGLFDISDAEKERIDITNSD